MIFQITEKRKKEKKGNLMYFYTILFGHGNLALAILFLIRVIISI